jgi:hypothetical protein
MAKEWEPTMTLYTCKMCATLPPLGCKTMVEMSNKEPIIRLMPEVRLN